MLDRTIDELTLSDVISSVDTLDAEPGGWPLLRVAFLANVTLDPILPYLKYLCYQDGLRLQPYQASYDTALQEAMDPGGGLYAQTPDIVVVCMKMELLSERLTDGFARLTGTQVAEECDRVVGFFRRVTSEIRSRSRAVILVHSFEPPVFPILGLMDSQSPERQAWTIRRINAEVMDAARQCGGCYIVDMERLRSLLGHRHFADPRYWHLAKAPYTREAWREIAKEYARFIRAVRGKVRKCLVLDCDNTLWGGVVGEDGVAGLRLGHAFPGSAYREFQSAIVGLRERGVLLALCSKNNESDVLEVLRSHPDMVLRREHFVAMKVNWADKVDNLRAIARELNIGLDTMVFCDDSDFELELVKSMVPEVRTLGLPRDPSQYRDVLLSCGLFDTLTLSEEDRTRSEMYRAEQLRTEARQASPGGSLQDFLRDLEMVVNICRADDLSAPRVAQLTQRTNQFNLTAQRYDEADIRALGTADAQEVLALALEDRFGGMGLVGMAILRYAGQECLIDAFLLSCRAIGRGVEDVLLADCISRAQLRGCATIVGQYAPTLKNVQVADFYPRHGFEPAGNVNSVSSSVLHLATVTPRLPEHFKSVTTDGRSFYGAAPPASTSPTGGQAKR